MFIHKIHPQTCMRRLLTKAKRKNANFPEKLDENRLATIIWPLYTLRFTNYPSTQRPKSFIHFYDIKMLLSLYIVLRLNFRPFLWTEKSNQQQVLINHLQKKNSFYTTRINEKIRTLRKSGQFELTLASAHLWLVTLIDYSSLAKPIWIVKSHYTWNSIAIFTPCCSARNYYAFIEYHREINSSHPILIKIQNIL